MSTEAFNQLRTQEQLGYIVSLGLNVQADSVLALVLQVGLYRLTRFSAHCDDVESAGTCVTAQVQSANSSVAHLVARSDAFVSQFRGHLESLSADAISTKAAVLAARILESDKTPQDEAARLWGPVHSGLLDFHTSEATAAAVTRLSKGDVLAFYDACLMPGGSHLRRLAAGIYAPGAEKSSSLAATGNVEGPQALPVVVSHGGGPASVPLAAVVPPPARASSWLVPPLAELAAAHPWCSPSSALPVV